MPESVTDSGINLLNLLINLKTFFFVETDKSVLTGSDKSEATKLLSFGSFFSPLAWAK
jgi:hypothetical protein